MPGRIGVPGGVAHSTEHRRPAGINSKSQLMQKERNKGGRPPGSKNKPKGLIPTELAREMLGIVKEILPPEHYAEMRKSVLEGKHISTLQEAKITLKLMGPPIWKALMEERRSKKKVPEGIDPEIAAEINGEEPQDSGFGRPLNERMKIYLSMLQFVDKVEERHEQSISDRAKPNITVITSRGIDAGRLRSLTEEFRSAMGGDPDGTGRQAIEARTVSDQIVERQVDLQDSEQGETTGAESGSVAGDGVQRMH